MVMPMEVPDEELHHLRDSQAWKLEEAIAVWNGTNPFIQWLASGPNGKFWRSAFAPSIRERLLDQENFGRQAIIAKKLEGQIEGSQTYVNPQAFLSWALSTFGNPMGDTVADFFDSLRESWAKELAQNESDLCSSEIEEQQDEVDLIPQTTNSQDHIFREMDNLQFPEITLTFVGDRKEFGAGANTLLEIEARGKRCKVSLSEFGLVNRTNGEANQAGVLLIGLASERSFRRGNDEKTPKKAKLVSRLRKLLQDYFGNKDDPFMPHNNSDGWTPRFMIKDQRGRADDRAKVLGEKRTITLDEAEELNHLLANDEDESESEDPADQWMREEKQSWRS